MALQSVANQPGWTRARVLLPWHLSWTYRALSYLCLLVTEQLPEAQHAAPELAASAESGPNSG